MWQSSRNFIGRACRSGRGIRVWLLFRDNRYKRYWKEGIVFLKNLVHAFEELSAERTTQIDVLDNRVKGTAVATYKELGEVCFDVAQLLKLINMDANARKVVEDKLVAG